MILYLLLACQAEKTSLPQSEEESVEVCASTLPHPSSAPLRRLTAQQYQNSIYDLLGVDVPLSMLPKTTLTKEYRSWQSNNRVSTAVAESLLLAAEWIVHQTDFDALADCDTTQRDCAETWLLDFAFQTYRRPLTPTEKQQLRMYFEIGVDVPEALQLAVALVIQSPAFLYYDGFSPTSKATVLNDYALATRLAFFLTNSTPDAELLDMARTGQLRDRQQLYDQAVRLLQAPTILQTLTNFHRDWLHLYTLQGTQRDEQVYPQFSDDLLEEMLIEQDLFVTELMWLRSPYFSTLLTESQSWVSPSLAQLYEINQPVTGWQLTELPANSRPGILTRAAFLSAHANTASSSPVRRGAFVLQQLLCESLSPPADINMNIPPSEGDEQTIRDRLQAHQTDASCAACHQRIDAAGFTFEHYGAIGEWRDDWENGVAINAKAELYGQTFDDAAQLVQWLESNPTAQQCYAQQWFTYAMGRPVAQQDDCSIRQLKQRFSESNGYIYGLLLDITQLDSFRYYPLEKQ